MIEKVVDRRCQERGGELGKEEQKVNHTRTRTHTHTHTQ